MEKHKGAYRKNALKFFEAAINSQRDGAHFKVQSETVASSLVYCLQHRFENLQDNKKYHSISTRCTYTF
jgi:hypothetical protein